MVSVKKVFAKSQSIAIFASGVGTNTRNIIKEFREIDIKVGLIVTNNPNAGVIDIAKENTIPYLIITKGDFRDSDSLIKSLKKNKISLIVLAGFLWLIPIELIKAFSNRIINIHPALLPLYGGKGMYGMKVHKAVKKSGDKYTGITIHYVNEKYDEGNIIFQQKVEIADNDSFNDIAAKVHQLEYKYFPKVILELLT